MSTVSKELFRSRYLNDPNFHAAFLADPKPLLAEMGWSYPATVTVHVVETGPKNIGIIFGRNDLYREEQLQTILPQIDVLVARAHLDPEFRRSLLADPAEALFQELEYRAPSGVRVSAYECSQDHVYFPVWIDEPIADSEELSEFDLEQITGGRGNIL